MARACSHDHNPVRAFCEGGVLHQVLVTRASSIGVIGDGYTERSLRSRSSDSISNLWLPAFDVCFAMGLRFMRPAVPRYALRKYFNLALEL